MLNKRFLFFIERELHIPLLKPVMEYISENHLGVIGIYSIQYNPGTEEYAQSGLRVSTIQKTLDFSTELVEDPYEFKPDITFMADFSYHFVEGLGKIVNIGHGTISKGWFFSERNISKRENCADLVCVPGNIHKEILQEQVFRPIEVTGMPKLDRLFTEEWIAKDEIKNLGLNPENKTILFAPTFNKELSIVPHIGFDLHKYIPSFLNIIIKLHGASPQKWFDKYREFASHHENVYFAEELDVTKYLAISDVLISDVSSVIFEFAVTDKPVICYDSPTQKNYINYNENDLEYKYRNIGTKCDDINKLQETLFRLMTTIKTTNNIAEKFISVKDGSSAKKVVEAALKLTDNTLATIVIDNAKTEQKEEFRNKFSDRFNLKFISEIEKKENPSLRLFHQIARDSQNDIVIYYDAKYTLSPQLPTFLTNHFKYYEDAGILVPLKPNDGTISQQNIQYYIKQSSQMSNYQIGFQITYSNPGVSNPIEFPENAVFAIDKNILLEEMNFTNNKGYWFGFLAACNDNSKKSRLAFDTYIYIDDTMPDKKPEEIVEPEKTEERSATQEDNLDSLFSGTEFEQDESSFSANSLTNNLGESDFAKQERELKQELEADPFNNDLIKKLVYFYLEHEKYDSAETFANMIPDDQEAVLLSAVSLEKQNLIDMAYEKMNQISNLSAFQPNQKILYYISMAKIKMKKNSLFGVDDYLDKALKIQPENVEALLAYGSFFLLSQEIEAANSYIQKAEKIDPNNFKVIFGKAIIKQNLGEFETALDLYEKCLQIVPNDMNIIDGMVKCSFQLGQFDKARKAVENYLHSHPQNTNMLFILANIYFSSKNMDKALQTIRKLLALEPEYKTGKELEQRILNELK